MKNNIKISAYVGIAFISSFVLLVIFLQLFSIGFLTTEKNILEPENIFGQNPKHATISVLRDISGQTESDSITINSLGFRGDEFSEIKQENTYRIFLVGGSPMFGFGASSDETTIPGFLQDLLNKEDLQFNVEVINAGIQGVGSDTELELITQKLIKFSPDLIIVYDGWHDLRSNNDAELLKENWQSICDLGIEHNFSTIISLHPIAGFGEKTLTQTEFEYVKAGKSYSEKPLIESMPLYEKYAQNLSELKNCEKTLDFRNVFDNEISTMYIDMAHVHDEGNRIVAKSLSNEILPIISEDDELNAFQNKNSNDTITGLLYNEREITVDLELIHSDLTDEITLKVNTYDNTNKKEVENVTYFLSISYNDERLLNQYFFAEDGILLMNIEPSDDTSSKVIGEIQYLHNAYVTIGSEYMPDMTGKTIKSKTPLQLIGPILNKDGIYTFDIDLRTLDDSSNAVYTLSDYHYEINFKKST